jgi:hypothetical protein
MKAPKEANISMRWLSDEMGKLKALGGKTKWKG